MTWQPIGTCNPEPYEKIDLWAVDRKTGRGWRVPDAYRATATAPWVSSQGRVVTGKRFYDPDDGEGCFDWHCTDEQSVVVTHWMPPPAAPIS
jgi:hypothetical protein